MNLIEALKEAQDLANKNGYRVAIIDNDGLDVVKLQACADYKILPLEIIRPDSMKPPKAFCELQYRHKYVK
jgi:hypothetical protein